MQMEINVNVFVFIETCSLPEKEQMEMQFHCPETFVHGV